MFGFVDTAIALRIIYLLVKPIESFDAYKLGLIDASGKTIKKAKTPEEKNATSMLFRLVWNLKRVISLAPGGSTRIGSLAAAYLLVKEAYNNKMTEEESTKYFTENYDKMWTMPFEEREIVEEAFRVIEDAPANASGAAVSTDVPTIRPKTARRFAEFNVDDKTFDAFKNGKAKFRRWSNYLDLNNEEHKQIHEFARKNPRGIIVLKNSAGHIKGIRYSRKGSGNWANIQRKPKALAESILYDEIFVEEINDV